MCPDHLRAALRDMANALKTSQKGGPKVLCVSTQVIEADEDISFGAVVRLTAGIDDAIQAGSWCNRNGESSQPALVYLLSCSNENLGKFREIREAKTASLQLLSAFRRNPAAFENDLSSDSSIARYYQNLYGGMALGAQDYQLEDAVSLFDLLSGNEKYTAGQSGLDRFGLHQAFSTAGHAFQVFDQETVDVLVPYGEGQVLIAALSSPKLRYDPAQQRALLEQARAFIISLNQSQRDALERQGGLRLLLDGAVLALDPDFYDREIGLIPGP